MKRICLTTGLLAGTLALLCVTGMPRLSSDKTGSTPTEVPLSEGFWRRAAQRSIPTPAKLNELQALTTEDSSRGIEAFEQFLGGADEFAREEVFAWLADQPAAAASWIESQPDGPFRNMIIDRVLGEMARRSPSAALAVAEALTTPDLCDAALTSVFRQWASNSPIEALNAVVGREEWRDTPLVGRAFVAAATSSPHQIKEFLSIVPREALDASFLANATTALLAKDPNAIPVWFESLPSAELRTAIAENVMFTAGRNQPDLAFVWATQLPDAAQRQDALRRFMHRTAQRHPEAVSALLNSPWLSSNDRDALLAFFVPDDTAQ